MCTYRGRLDGLEEACMPVTIESGLEGPGRLAYVHVLFSAPDK